MVHTTQQPFILCSTARLARSLQLAVQQQQLKSGAAQWQAQPIFTLADWLHQVTESALLAGEIDASTAPTAMLNNTQETLLWEQSIAQSLKNHAAADLFDTTGLASVAMEANALMTEWHLKVESYAPTEETRQFLQWRKRFQVQCKQLNVLESVRYLAWQISCLQQGAGTLPAQIQLAGFDRIHPHMARLLEVLKSRGVAISHYPLGLTQPQNVSHIMCDDQQAECRAAVVWAWQMLTKNPQATLAIVVPELAALRDQLADLLDDTFHPQTTAPGNAEATRCYDFSLGVPLASLPIVKTALDLIQLAWQKQAVNQPELAQLLNSVYWSAHSIEADARAKLDARMRQKLPLSIKPNSLLRFMQSTATDKYPLVLPLLTADFQRLLQHAQQQPRLQTPAQWSATFKALLEATHWPGDRPLSSHEYQAVQSFQRVLDELAALDKLFEKMTAPEAIKRLSQLCTAQIFQPERKTPAQILIMGMLEAAAEPLDGMWIMGMNDHSWPPVARLNPLIAPELQRQAGTPNASSEVQSAFAHTLHQRLIHSANVVIFSSASRDGDRQLRISPLMQGIAPNITLQANVLDLAQHLTLAEKLAQASTHDWQWLDDFQAPPVLADETISGGTALLKAQAICPAWAFFQYRLGARQLDEPVNGLDAMARGNLVHAVLAQYWSSGDLIAADAASLQNTPPEQLKQQLKAIADQILKRFNRENDAVFSEAFLALEAERLVKLTSAWLLEIEAQRPQGFRVLACEQPHQLEIEGIQVRLVIDRIDTLEDGRLLVLDYKTGSQTDYKNWAQNQISEPQLPIYAAFVLKQAEVAAVCYAKIRPADLAFIGVAANANIVQGVTVFDDTRGSKLFDTSLFPDWQSIIQHWHTRISATALALKQGDAAICFENEQQLQYCEVLPLLRLPERLLQYERQQQSKHL